MSIHRTLRRTAAATVVAVTGAVAATAAPASAHVSVVTYGTTFTAGSTNVFFFRVPHGCPDDVATYGANARTTQVVVDVPAGVTGLKPQFVPGWDVAVVKDGTGRVTRVTWTAGPGNALPDWTFGDFGVRATLNGAEGDKLVFPTVQVCGVHDDGSPATGLEERWEGADAPTITLVAAAKAVNNAAGLADLKATATAANTDVKALAATVADLRARTEKLESGLAGVIARAETLAVAVAGSHWTGDAVASLSRGRLTVNVDLAAIHRGQTVEVRSGDRTIGTLRLSAWGDALRTFPANASAGLEPGAVIDVVMNGTTMASTPVA